MPPPAAQGQIICTGRFGPIFESGDDRVWAAAESAARTGAGDVEGLYVKDTAGYMLGTRADAALAG